MKNNRKGFTLIELLVVIAIIGLLSTLAVVALNNARTKSRDARRVADIKQMRTAMELYYNDMNGYPAAVAEGGTIAGGGTTYMGIVPTNPAPNGTAYTYTQDAADTYHITYTLEADTGGILAGLHCATPSGMVDDGGADCP
jgi:prepilin-type N-terminal cleavage/methylation domain-containing protein